MKQINLKIKNIEKGKRTINYENNKMWEDDIITTSNRVDYEVNGCKCGCYTKSDNMEEIIEEITPQIILDEYLEEDYTFKDLGLCNPRYSTYDDGDGEVCNVVDYLNLRDCEVHLINEEEVIDSLVSKGRGLFKVVLV